MIRHIRYFFLLALISTVISCKKKTPEDIGLPFLPDNDLLNAQFSDTATLISHTVRDDSLKTDEAAIMLLGSITDPIFGFSESSFFTQFSLSKTGPAFGTNPILDSAVLSLVYNGGQYYGTLYPQQFKVYEMTEALYRDSTYYSNRMLSYATELASISVVPNVKDSVKVDSLKFPPHLRIKLDNNFFQNFFNDTTSYISNTNFQNYFKGLYIASTSVPPTGQGAILYMDITHFYSRLTLYYHNNSADSLSYFFNILKDACARFSHFEHDYSAAIDIQSQLITSPNIQEDKVFVQPMAGVRTKITMPYIQDFFKNGKVAINKAELIIPVIISTIDSVFSPPARLVVNISDSFSVNVPNDYFEGADYFGGSYDATKKEYRFNIARYVQQVLNGTINNRELYINIYNVRIGTVFQDVRRTTANRVVLMGGDMTNLSRMRLKITYTPIE